MRTFKAIKGIKVNGEEGDGHPDGVEVYIIAQQIVSEEQKEMLKKSTGKDVEKMYFAIFPEDRTPLPIGISDFKIEITSNEVFDYVIQGNHGRALEEYYNDIIPVITDKMKFELIK